MTRNEIRLALKQLEDRGAYSLRLFLDDRTTVMAHQWYLDEGEAWGDGADEDSADRDDEGLLRIVARGRQALIAVSSIVLIEMVPFGG